MSMRCDGQIKNYLRLFLSIFYGHISAPVQVGFPAKVLLVQLSYPFQFHHH